MGVATPPVRHIGYIWQQANRHAYGHHMLDPGTPPGAWRCGICNRLVIRGMGRWWR